MSITQPGFADPIAESQSCFRAVLDAMARPGTVHAAGGGLAPPAPLTSAAAAVLLTLVDQDTALWLDPAASAAREWIAFHCGARIVPDPRYCNFALALRLPEFAELPTGSDEVPESSATLVLQVNGFTSGRRYRLAGPGLREPALLQVDGLPAEFCAAWQWNHALFPCGIDIVLCAGTELAALPRSVTVREA